MTSLSW